MSLPERITARVLLFDEAQRLLLMHYKNFQVKDGPSFWATIGGALDPGETLEAGARREVLEETGLADIALGPIVWTGEWTIEFEGQPRRFKESFLVARTQATDLSFDRWTPLERDMLIGPRWWTLEELQAARETIYPIKLPRLIAPLMEGRYPDPPIRLREK